MGILTRNGYKIPKSSLPNLAEIRKQLLAKPYVPKVFNPWGVQPYKLYDESDSFLYVPKHWGIQTFGEPTEILCTASVTPDEYWTFAGGLRESQQEVVRSYLEPVKDGLICLQTGGGKTVCALYIASQIKMKTLIVVHNTFLRDQWIDRIKAFLPKARIGRIQGEDVDVLNKDVVIAMIQSISMKEYPKDTFAGFGLTIIDECHHIASEVFVRAFPKVTSKHMLGLSATPERKDGLMHVITWFLGPILYRSDTSDHHDPDVRVEAYTFETDNPDFNRVVYNNQGVMATALMINKLAEFEPRTKFLCELIEDVMNVSDGKRQLLVLSDRVDHCKEIHKMLPESIKHQACILSRDTKAETRAEWCVMKKILIATYQMCKEGFDVPTLNTLVIATPRPDVDQIVGRILRVEKSKRTIHPLILDIVDTTFRRQFQERCSLYKKRNYTIEMMKLSDG
jgi:superfamily II DNA or RNA helicase